MVGNLEDMTVVVNGVPARLPKAHAQMDVMSLERNLTIVDGRLESLRSSTSPIPPSDRVTEWSFDDLRLRDEPVREFRGTTVPTGADRLGRQGRFSGSSFPAV